MLSLSPEPRFVTFALCCPWGLDGSSECPVGPSLLSQGGRDSLSFPKPIPSCSVPEIEPSEGWESSLGVIVIFTPHPVWSLPASSLPDSQPSLSSSHGFSRASLSPCLP